MKMSIIEEYISTDKPVFLVVCALKSGNEYCFKFDKKPFKDFWFVSVQAGTWSEKHYPSICTIKQENGAFTVSKNAKFDEQFEYSYNCLKFIFDNLQNEQKLKENVKLFYGKINLV